MDAERHWSDLDPRLWRSREDLEAEIERLKAALERCNRERRMMFREIIVLEYELYRRKPHQKAHLHGNEDSKKRTLRRRRQRADAVTWFLFRLVNGKKFNPQLDKERKLEPKLLREILTRKGADMSSCPIDKSTQEKGRA